MGRGEIRRRNEGSIKIGPRLLEILSQLGEIELEDVEIEVEDLEIWWQPGVGIVAPPKIVPPPRVKPTEILPEPFEVPLEEYPGRVEEVVLGATKAEGGTRAKRIVIGGAESPAFYLFERKPAHPPVIAIDTFDMKTSLPRAIRMYVEEVMEDPPAWAKMAVDKLGADLVSIHLISTDPLIRDTSPKEAAKTVEDVLQAVDVPIIVGGCGDPRKDAEVFTKVAEVAEGERLLLSSVTLDMDEAGILGRVAKAAKDHGHAVLAFSSMELNKAKELNRKLYAFLPRDSIVMDLTTAALGYGLEYSFSIHERARLAALMGDPELQHPVLSGTTNAWAAREAWLRMGPEWEPRELRGALWETITALALLLAGVDVFMMMHPDAVRTVKKVIEHFNREVKPETMVDWVSARI
ncbi:CO dehydrogenase/acetyl-CoA synthase subunit delta [Candidatus Bathyarchaeota archaeon]|nr:CO dehydrogenase/acetyl-CoA synthase subunit delta [Candidatus Bathyarchaeota archaeon]